MSKLKKIIYIDDDEDILSMAEYALTEIGKYDVLTCQSGAEALAKIEDYKPDLILIDVMMPALDGTETISKIRKLTLCKTTPAIFITAKIVPPEVADLLSHDVAVIALIHKPYDSAKISETVQSLWDSSFSKDSSKSIGRENNSGQRGLSL